MHIIITAIDIFEYNIIVDLNSYNSANTNGTTLFLLLPLIIITIIKIAVLDVNQDHSSRYIDDPQEPTRQESKLIDCE